MAALTHGPRLGDPRSDGFKVWVRADGAATATLHVGVAGGALTLVDTAAIDVTKENTAVLTVTGLLDSTPYDYRVDLDGVAGTTYMTVTMPPTGGGNWVMYWLSDCHAEFGITPPSSAMGFACEAIVNDWQTNHAANNTPAIIFLGGDLIDPNSAKTASERVALALTEIAYADGSAGRAFAHFPVIYMWDDWDFGGNNSNRANFPHCNPTNITVPTAYWDALFRDHPRPAAPSWGYSYVIAGVPIIAADSRSQKAPTATSGDLATGTLLWGNESYSFQSDLWGSVQHEWLRARLREYSDRALVFFISSHTFRDQILPVGLNNGFASGSRDSCGIYHKAARNDLFRSAYEMGYGDRANLVVLSGDDHRNSAWAGLSLGPPVRWDGSDGSANARPGFAFPLNFAEFKVNSHNGGGNLSPTIMGYGNLGDWADGTLHSAILRFEIASSTGGTHTSMRATYIHTGGFSTPPGLYGIPTSENGPAAGRLMDFYFQDGHWSFYGETTTLLNQLYPHNNARYGARFKKGFVDDVLGTIHAMDEVGRDRKQRLRRLDDIDAPDKEDTDPLHNTHRRIEHFTDPY